MHKFLSSRLNPKNTPSAIYIGTGLFAGALLYLGISQLKLEIPLPCTFAYGNYLTLTLILLTLLDLFLGRAIQFRGYKAILGVNILLILLALWLSSYKLSPLGFSTGRIPVLHNFLLTTFFRSNIKVASGGTITLTGGSDASIHLDTLPVKIHCLWSSAADAALDDPQSCDTVYSPPNGIALDVLKVDIQAECGLPEVQGQIKVNILP